MVKYSNPGPILSRWPRGKASHPAPEPRSRPSRQCGDGHIPSALSRQSPDVKLLDSPGKQPGHVNHVIDNWIAIYYWIAIWSIWVYMQLLACESWCQRMLKDYFCFRVFFGIHLPTLWIWKGQAVEMSKHWGFHGGTPIAGWFISWNILLKWMMWRYPHGLETSLYQNTVERTLSCIQATVLLLLKICATCQGQCSFPTYHCPFTVHTLW